MVGRFRTPLKLAPVWNVLITSICKESESEIALLHSQREVKREKGRVVEGSGRGRRSWGMGQERKSQIFLTHKVVVRSRGKRVHCTSHFI